MEHLDNLNEARDAVRRHVEAKQQLDKEDLDIICETVSHTIAKIQPCDNADFQGESHDATCLLQKSGYVEEFHCSCSSPCPGLAQPVQLVRFWWDQYLTRK